MNSRKQYTIEAENAVKNELKACQRSKNRLSFIALLLFITAIFLLPHIFLSGILIALSLFILFSEKDVTQRINELSAMVNDGTLYIEDAVHISGLALCKNSPCTLIIKKNCCEIISDSKSFCLNNNRIRSLRIDRKKIFRKAHRLIIDYKAKFTCKSIVLEFADVYKAERILRENLR